MKQWPAEYETLEEQVQDQLNGNWRRLFIAKPRPRLDGVYISLNSYIRSGQTEGQYDQPVFKIRYYRYLRFFSDGSVVLLCTPQTPKSVVPQLRNGISSIFNGKEHLDTGSFVLIDENLLSESKIFIESTKSNSKDPIRTNYCYSLRLASSYHGWHDRLIVEDYFIEKDNVKNCFEKGFIKTFKFVHVPKHIFVNTFD